MWESLLVFSSFEFLFLFLPIVYICAIFLFRYGSVAWGIRFVVLGSLFFYGFWNPSHLWIIICSVVVNYVISNGIIGETIVWRRRLFLIIGIIFNLSFLFYFKYLGFFSNIINANGGDEFFGTVLNAALPIGISFYTFQQIAFLVDCHQIKKKTPYSFSEYAFFVTFFPQLIAGPIVHHTEIMPQLARLRERLQGKRYSAGYLAPGIALLVIGLCKKILIADTFGIFADDSFSPTSLRGLTFLDAWGGASAYTFQIYFDFSGYSDMAIGLGLLFGLRLPVNFLSPYKSTSIIDFWRRWHVTLSRFLRDYVYFPLGGNRRGCGRRYINLLATMVIGGLWHGANWTFVVWGLLHGFLLAVNHGIRSIVPWRPPVGISIPVTFVIIVLTWVPFRAEDLHSMLKFYEVMLGGDGIVLPWRYEPMISALGPIADAFSIRVGDVRHFGGLRQVLATILALFVVFFAPNAMTILISAGRRRLMRSKLAPIGLGSVATLMLLVMYVRSNVTFLYFQF